MKKILMLVIAMCWVPSLSAATAISLQTRISNVAEDGGRTDYPVGRWVGQGELRVRFIVSYGDFKTIDARSMRYELTGDTIKLVYKLTEVPHDPDAPAALCSTTRALVYVLKGLAEKPYQVEVDGSESVAAHGLPMINLSPGVPNAIEVSVTEGGKKLLLDGKPATKEEILDTIRSGDRLQTSVWIYRDSHSQVAEDLLEFAADQPVPVAMAEKADFSDVLAKVEAAAGSKE